MPENQYNQKNYTPAELRLVEAEFKKIASRLSAIKSAPTKLEKLELANSLAKSEQATVMTGPTNAAVVFNLVGESLFTLKKFMAASENEKLNMRAGKEFFGHFQIQFKDYFFSRAAMESFDQNLLANSSAVLIKLANEDPVFRKYLIGTMDTILLTKKGKIDDSVTFSTIIAPGIKATELIGRLQQLQKDTGLGSKERDLYRVTEQSIRQNASEVKPEPQVPMKH